ncbi:alanine/arginine aminopeptidase [Trichoderma asperellum]|uniref:Aminopeptidase n=1 Tax=Trichoderma asperellum TaxID=101201 RepID=A0A6V8R4D8_TRIAP|nr:alanine/arginine aminopeptidase [Trichoderma asperellum]
MQSPQNTDDEWPRCLAPENFRLPSKINPIHYDLTLEPHFEKAAYSGNVIIQLEVLEEAGEVTLHSENLIIVSAFIEGPDRNNRIPFLRNVKAGMINFFFGEPLSAGETASLRIKFTGSLRNDISGFYASHYNNPNGSKGVLAVTHMAPTYARRAFPCFDEPAFKATFLVNLISDSHHTCLSNMDIDTVQQLAEQGKKITRFHKTPPMSSYLVSCAVGDLQYIQNMESRVPIRIYTTPSDNVQLTQYAAHIVARGLKFYEDKFKVRFPLPKLDFLAAPTFLPGAVENWGMIMGQSSFFPFDNATDGEDKREAIAETLLHELAHMWFGDLVTVEWWDQLWLNEGGATAMTIDCLRSLEPTWTSCAYRRTGSTTGALGIDAYRSTHPVEMPISSPDDISQGFDQVTYSKGAFVLCMLRDYLTPDIFFAAISDYLQAHAYSNAKTSGLWASFEKICGQDIASLMDPWTKKPGYPYIIVSEKDGEINLEQHRFLFTGDERAGLISDAFAFAQAGNYKTSSVLDLVRSLGENDYLPWTELADQFQNLFQAYIGNQAVSSALKSFYVRITAPISHRLGWDFTGNGDHETQLFKALAFVEAGIAGDSKVLQAAKLMFDKFANGDEHAIHKSIQLGVFRMVLLNGGAKEYDVIFDHAKHAPSSYSRRIAAQSLLATEDPALVKRTLNAILSKELEPSEAPITLKGLGYSRTARDMAWAWVQENWAQLILAFPDTLGSRDRIIRFTTLYLTTRNQLLDLGRLIKEQDIRGVERELDHSVEYAQGIIQWVERDTPDVEAWLENWLENEISQGIAF